MRSTVQIFLFLFSINLCAQEGLIVGNADSLDLEQVIISASRSSVHDPLTFQNISSDKIETIYNGQDPAVLLQQLSPSIISYSDAGTDIGNYAQFRMRGIDQSRINITLNGVPLNDMVDQGVYFSNFSDFGNSIESIQVQRGVSASNAGVASYGGAINFESPNIFSGDLRAEQQLTVGSFGTLRTATELRTGLMKNKLGAYARMTRTRVGGYKIHSASDAFSFFGSAGYAGEKDIIKITGFMGKTQNDQSYLPVLLSDIETDPKTNYNHPNDTDDFEQELIQVQYTRSLSNATQLGATVYYGGARGVFPFAIDDETQFVYGLSNDHYGIMSHLTHTLSNVLLKAGIQANTFDRTNYEYVAPNVGNPYDRDFTKKNDISAFGKVSYNLNNLNLYADLQVRSVAIDFSPDEELETGMNLNESWFFVNFVTGLSYNISQGQSIYASFGRAGREPTRSDIRNGVLEAEYANDLELGWRMQTDKWNINANLFNMMFDNEISSVGALMERSYMEIRQNVPSSRRSGLELAIAYKPTSKVAIDINAAYMNTNVSEFDNGTETINDVQHIFAPNFVFRPQVNFSFSDQIGLILSGRKVSASFMELSNIKSFELPAHTVFNAQLDVDVTPKASISFMLNNIFDELYFTDGAPVDLDFDGVVEGPGFRVQPPRHFYMVFKVGF